jgi:AmmeMemoRadiSam system protein A
MLTTPQRNQLLQIARESIEAVLAGRRPALPAHEQLDDPLKQPSGCFVSLHAKGSLRGCIGTIQAMAPLYQAVSSSAISAAFRDPRFFPLAAEELPEIDLEISVMSPIVAVRDLTEIEVGRDGLIVTRGRSAGLLLPQVATQYGWDRDTFLSHTCAKAGLHQDAWRSPDIRIERFSAEVFGELNC